MNYREGEKNKSFKSHLESTDIHHEIMKWELERQINGFRSDVEHDAWMTLSFPPGWIMSSLASVCHLISQSVSTVRAVIIWTQQVKGVCSFLNGSRPKNLLLLEKENKNKLLCGKPEKIRGRAGDLAVGKLKSGVWDHPALLQGHMKASFSSSPPSVSAGEEEEHLLICLQCTDLVDCLQANPSLRGQYFTCSTNILSQEGRAGL